MADAFFLGFDLGTSGLRGLLIDAHGNSIASAEAHYDVAHPQQGWSEQDPAAWIEACQTVASALRSTAPHAWAGLSGIGVSGHMHGAVLLDAAGEVIRPCILWNDTRSFEQAAILDATPQVRELSGNIVFPGFTAPKCMWVAQHEPANFARIHKVLLPAAYLNYWLTGAFVGDMSDAAGTSWLDTGMRAWSDKLLAASGMRADQMPRVIEGCEAAGTLREDHAQAWGLPKGVQIVGGAGDNAAAACGAGVLAEGQGFVSLGTSGVLLAAKDSYAPMPSSAVHTFCHAVPGRWYQMGVILAATDCLNWLSQTVGESPADLTRALGAELKSPGTLQFLPYLSGERTPYNDSQIRGAFIGLDIATNKTDMTRAVLEGVSFALRDSFEALKSTGTGLDRVLAIGGGSQSDHWVEMIATVLNLPVDLPESGEFGAALGAARLAQCGVTGADPKSIMTPPPVARTIAPNAVLVPDFEAAYARYQRLYPAMKALQ